MKTFLFTSLLALSFSTFADDSKPIEEVKKMKIEALDLRIAQLTAAKACVQAAADKEALHKCRADLKEGREDMRSAMKSKKEAFKAKRDAEKANKKN